MSVVPLMISSEAGAGPLAPDLANSLVELLESAGKEFDGNRTAARVSIARATSLLRVALDRSASGMREGSACGTLAGWQVHRVKLFIDEHLDRSIQTKDLAAVAQRSTAYFCRAFKRTFGETPHTFIIRRRVTRAGHLMLASDLSLSEIALSCGFTDQAHLSKLFRQSHGQSPAVWRRERRAIVGERIEIAVPASASFRASTAALRAVA